MFDAFKETLGSWATALYGMSDSAIAAMCGIVWGPIFASIAGIIIGWNIMMMLFEDDIISGGKKLLVAIIPMLVVAWLINSSGGRCRVVTIKNDVLALQATMITAVTSGGFSLGTEPSDMVVNVMTRTGSLFRGFFNDVQAVMYTQGGENLANKK